MNYLIIYEEPERTRVLWLLRSTDLGTRWLLLQSHGKLVGLNVRDGDEELTSFILRLPEFPGIQTLFDSNEPPKAGHTPFFSQGGQMIWTGTQKGPDRSP